MVDMFRKAEVAAKKAKALGLKAVQNRCTMVEYKSINTR